MTSRRQFLQLVGAAIVASAVPVGFDLSYQAKQVYDWKYYSVPIVINPNEAPFNLATREEVWRWFFEQKRTSLTKSIEHIKKSFDTDFMSV